MDDRFNVLSGAILDKPLEQCTVKELEELTAKYPYFSAAHFLLIRKKEQEGEDSSSLMQKAILYYHHPVAFSHFLHPKKTNEQILKADEEKPVPVTPPFREDAEPVAERIPERQMENAALMMAEDDLDERGVPNQQTEEVAGDPATEKPEPRTGETAPGTVIEQRPEPVRSESPAPVSMPDKTEEVLAFEPFHTVDYFASQGIKPSKEEPKDTLGKQLKSFTEWLKTMKKLPDTPVSKETDPKVEALADKSIGTTVVVTEAMAEVWLKQGNKERAADIYRKLSLLEPSKSAYFAAKIDNLNAD